MPHLTTSPVAKVREKLVLRESVWTGEKETGWRPNNIRCLWMVNGVITVRIRLSAVFNRSTSKWRSCPMGMHRTCIGRPRLHKPRYCYVIDIIVVLCRTIPPYGRPAANLRRSEATGTRRTKDKIAGTHALHTPLRTLLCTCSVLGSFQSHGAARFGSLVTS